MKNGPGIDMCKTCQQRATEYVFALISASPQEHVSVFTSLALKCMPVRYPCPNKAVECCLSTVVDPAEAAAIDAAVFLEQIEEE